MAQDIIADGLNMLRNGKKARKNSVKIKRISNLFIEILKIMKQKGAIQKYKINPEEKSVEVVLSDFFECKAIKPRFSVGKNTLEKYRRRYLPARDIGTLIISTNKGLLTHDEIQKEEIGGSLIAYFY